MALDAPKGPEAQKEQKEAAKPSKDQAAVSAQETMAEAQNQLIEDQAKLFARQLATGGEKAYRDINNIRRDDSQPEWKRSAAKRALTDHLRSQDA